MLNLYKKYKEIINYIIFGILTTLISLLTYYILTNTILNPYNQKELQIANTISWIISVTFAYITNKLYVFNNKNKINIKEITKFYTSRLTTLLIDIILMHIFVIKLNFNDKIIKLINQIIVIILNYIISKLLIFKKN